MPDGSRYGKYKHTYYVHIIIPKNRIQTNVEPLLEVASFFFKYHSMSEEPQKVPESSPGLLGLTHGKTGDLFTTYHLMRSSCHTVALRARSSAPTSVSVSVPCLCRVCAVSVPCLCLCLEDIPGAKASAF